MDGLLWTVESSFIQNSPDCLKALGELSIDGMHKTLEGGFIQLPLYNETLGEGPVIEKSPD